MWILVSMLRENWREEFAMIVHQFRRHRLLWDTSIIEGSFINKGKTESMTVWKIDD